MEILYDSVTAFFCAIGVATVVWWVAEWVFRPRSRPKRQDKDDVSTPP